MIDYPTLTIHKKVGCGSIYCLFMEDEGDFYRLHIKGDNAKETPCGEANLNAIAKLLTFCLRRSEWEGTTQKGVIKQLLGERCNNYVANKEGIVSCYDAIGKAIKQYKEIKEEEKIKV